MLASPRLQALALPNGDFLLVIDRLPDDLVGNKYLQAQMDYARTTTGAKAVLTFPFTVDVNTA